MALAVVAGAALVVAPAPEAGAADVAVLPVGHWEQRFAQVAATDHSRNLPLSQSGDSRKFYDHAYSIDANVSMFEATGKASLPGSGAAVHDEHGR